MDIQKTVLVVDDSTTNRSILCDILHSDYSVIQAENGIQALTKLKKQDKNFKKMVANLSHDLRTPLTVIIGYLQLIRLEKNVNEPVNSYIEHIEKKYP